MTFISKEYTVLGHVTVTSEDIVEAIKRLAAYAANQPGAELVLDPKLIPAVTVEVRQEAFPKTKT